MLKVIIVDDSLIMRKQIREIMEDLGYEIVGEAKNNEEIISMHSRFKVDFITMDITMPGKDGITTTAEIRREDKDVKIIMVTSHGQEAMVVDAIKAGASAYILKPVTEEKVSKVINTVFKIK